MAAGVAQEQTVGVVVVTHGGSGECLLGAAASIVGELAASTAVGVSMAEDFDAALTAAMRAAYAAQRAEIGPRGYDDRIFRRKAKATPRVRALTAEAEHLLTLRETHRLTGIPAVAYEPAP